MCKLQMLEQWWQGKLLGRFHNCNFQKTVKRTFHPKQYWVGDREAQKIDDGSEIHRNTRKKNHSLDVRPQR